MSGERNYSSVAKPLALTASVAAAATTLNITLPAGHGWPLVPYTGVLERGTSNEELVLVTAGTDAGNGTGTMTVTRGFNGTTAVAHPAGAKMEHVTAAIDFQDMARDNVRVLAANAMTPTTLPRTYPEGMTRFYTTAVWNGVQYGFVQTTRVANDILQIFDSITTAARFTRYSNGTLGDVWSAWRRDWHDNDATIRANVLEELNLAGTMKRVVGKWGQQTLHTAHATPGFNGPTDFGSEFIQSDVAGPGLGAQYYAMNLGLGSDYQYSQYVCQVAIPRMYLGNERTGIAFRQREGGTWGGWRVIEPGMRLLGQASSWTVSGGYIGTMTRAPSNNTYAHSMQGSFNFVANQTQAIVCISAQKVNGTYPMNGVGWRCTTIDTTPSGGRAVYLVANGGYPNDTVYSEFPLTGLIVGATYTMELFCTTDSYTSALPAGAQVNIHGIMSVKG